MQQDNPRTSEQGTDRPGRAFASTGMHRSAMQETNWHKLEKHRFAKEIADVLYTAAHRGDYSQLVIAALPMIMGDLRKAMHKEVSDKVVAEISKDHHMPHDAIERARPPDRRRPMTRHHEAETVRPVTSMAATMTCPASHRVDRRVDDVVLDASLSAARAG
jgi:protein required for attachment to host cells